MICSIKKNTKNKPNFHKIQCRLRRRIVYFRHAPGGVAQLGEIPHASIRSLVRVVAGTVWEEGFLACIVPLLLALLGC